MREVILCVHVEADQWSGRKRALRKAGFQVLSSSTEADALRLCREAQPNLILIDQVGDISARHCARLKSASENTPLVAVCSPAPGRRWARQADLRLPDTIAPSALAAIVRILLQVQAVERASVRIQCASAGDAGSRDARPGSHLQIRLDKLRRENELLSRQNKHLRELIPSVIHGLRSGLCSVSVVSSWILAEHGERMDASGREYLLLLKQSVEQMCKAIDVAYQQAGRLKAR